MQEERKYAYSVIMIGGKLHIMENFFTSDDKKTFITTNYLELFLPDENGVTVKEGLKIYGEWAV